MNTRKDHLQHTSKAGAVCRAGKSGAALGGHEHITLRYAEFATSTVQCEKCRNSKLFAFLQRGAAK